jgi:hypothetical protein
VTGIDFAPGMIERARRRPEAVRWDLGDVQSLPYDDGAFDVVSSSFGVIFAPDAQRAADELTRVCRGRIGLTSWELHPERELWARHSDEVRLAHDVWSTAEGIRALLPGFELELDRGVWWLEGEDFGEIWNWLGRAFPPHRERLSRMDQAQAAAVRADFADLYERHREDGIIRYPRPYLLATGATP